MHDETPLERARRRVGTLAQPFLLVDYRLRFDELVRQPPRADLRARAATAADLGALPPLPGTSGTATRLARGDVALLAVGEDGPVGCLWYARGPLRAPGFGFPIVAVHGECFAYGLRVDRQARRRGVGAALFAALVEHAGARDLTSLHGLVAIYNRAAVGVQRAIGARPSELVLGLTIRRRHALVLGRWRIRPAAPSPRYAGSTAAAGSGSARRSG